MSEGTGQPDALSVDFSAIFRAQPPPIGKVPHAESWQASLFLSFADSDYLAFRWFALADLPRQATFHLHQAVEKYLKSILLASDPTFERTRGHDLAPLARKAAALHPVLSDRSFELFCTHLSPYQMWGHYPERVFDERYPDQTYLTPRCNEGARDGISEMDLVIATLRETAIVALGAWPDVAYLLEDIVHRDTYWLVDRDPTMTDAQLSMRKSLLDGNLFFTPDLLPTYAQRYQQLLAYPLQPLPRQHPQCYARVGLKPPPKTQQP